MKMFIAEVRDIKDPMKSGRCKLRIYGQHDDEETAGDDKAVWGTPLMGTTTASTARSGTIPTGMEVGSRVMVCYASDDVNCQNPFILGSFHRAGSGNSTG